MKVREAFEAAQLENIPSWADYVEIVHPYTLEPLEVRESQISGLHAALSQDNHRFGLYDTMGAGKSLIAYLYTAYHVSIGNKVITIMPPKLLRQYKKNFYRMLPNVPVWMEIFHDVPSVRKKLLEKWSVDLPQVICTSPRFFKENALWFAAQGIKVLVADEARWISNPETQIADAIDLFMQDEGDCAGLIMQGTPARTDLTNLFGYIQFTSPGTYSSRDHFNRRHVKYQKIKVPFRDKSGKMKARSVYKIDGYKHRESLERNLFRRGRRYEVPLPTHTEILYKEVSLEGEHEKRYRQLVEEKLLIFEDNSIVDISESNKIRHTCMQAIMDPSMLQVEGESSMIETVREMLEEIDFDKTKVLLCAYYQHSVELLTKAFADYGAVALYGKVSGAKAEQAKQRFLTDPDCKVMVINYESGGVGLDGLQNVCHTGIAVEPISVPGDMDQTIGRLSRPGQTVGVTFWILLAEGTIHVPTNTERLKRARAIKTVVKPRGPLTKEELRNELLGVADAETEV